MAPELKVGDFVYIRQRKYIYEALEIVGETKFSWLLKSGWREWKIKKKPQKYDTSETRHVPAYNGSICIYLTKEACQRDEWLARNAYPLKRKLEFVSDYDTLRKIADIIGYVAEEAK